MRIFSDLLPWFAVQRTDSFMDVPLPCIIFPAMAVITFTAVAVSSGFLLATITSIALTALSGWAYSSLVDSSNIIFDNVENLHRTDNDVRNKIFADLEEYYNGIGEENPITRSELGEIRIINVSNLDSRDRETTLRNFADTMEPIYDNEENLISRVIIVG